MLADVSETIREKTVNAILKIRHEARHFDVSFRKFIVPTPNYEASHYSDITTDLCHKSIFTSKIASEEIASNCRRKFEAKNNLNHIQSVERIVELMTDASYKVCGFYRRDEFNRARITSRCLISVADTNAHYRQADL